MPGHKETSKKTDLSPENAESNYLPKRRSRRIKSLSERCYYEVSDEEEAIESPTTPDIPKPKTKLLKNRMKSVTTEDSSPNQVQTVSDAFSEMAVADSPRRIRTRTPSSKCLEALNLDEDLNIDSPPIRRSVRKRKNKSFYGDDVTTKPSSDQSNSSEEKEQSTDHSDEEFHRKSSTLYVPDLDVAGENLFSFRTPKKRGGMALLAASAPKTTGTPKTPKRSGPSLNSTTKTPRNIRARIKSELKKITSVESSDSDSTSDDSDDSDASIDTESGNSSSSSDGSDESNVKPVPRTVKPTASTTGRTLRTAVRKQQDYVPESEDYFNHRSNKKTVTSDRTMEHLKTPRLAHEDLFRLLNATQLSAVHQDAIIAMNHDHSSNFERWIFDMDEGFNILLYGVGSKRNIIEKFHETVLADETVLVVNGFFPSLTIKDILDGISSDILQISGTNRNLHKTIDAIEEELMRLPDGRIFLLIHNIDGIMLRDDSAQLLLSRLAKMHQIHLIASIDHINAPLLWDHQKLSNFDFSWWDCTTMLPYTEETAFENSMLVQNSGSLALSSIRNVLLSLTENARGIFLVIVQNQVDNKGNSSFQGIPFSRLYSLCREQFLVSSDMALRSQLTEFTDHNLLKLKRTVDGTEHLMIPIDNGLLQQFLEQQND